MSPSAVALITSRERWRELTGLEGTEPGNRRLTVSSWDTDLSLIGARMRGELSVGPASIAQPLVWHTTDARFSFSHWPETGGFIGNEVFADRCVIVIDLPRRRVGSASRNAAD